MNENRPVRYKTIHLDVGYKCNNNCVFCYESDTSEGFSYKKKSLDEIKEQLEKAALEYDMVIFLGAEPTLRSDFVDILKFAKGLGFKRLSFSTNGRQFKDPEFAKQVAESGVSCVAVSLVGGTAETHDAQTRSPGSFNELVAGLKNILPYQNDSFVISVSFTMNRMNYAEMGIVIDLLSELGVKEVSFRNTGPLSGRTFGKEELIMKMSDMSAYICDVMEKKGLLGESAPPFQFFLQEFLPCSLPVGARQHIFPNKVTGENKYMRMALCENCVYTECPGVLRTYADIYGTEEFKF
jgi:MoaA/NifB/PqqE/SkfB family radical SAM enzyme